MYTPHAPRRTRSDYGLTALRLIGLIYIALCLPDIYAEFHQGHGASVARARLAAAVAPGPQLADSVTDAPRPYPTGLVQRATVGDAVVATTRTSTG